MYMYFTRFQCDYAFQSNIQSNTVTPLTISSIYRQYLDVKYPNTSKCKYVVLWKLNIFFSNFTNPVSSLSWLKIYILLFLRICFQRLESHFKEEGIYWVFIPEEEDQCCLLLTNDPPNIYMRMSTVHSNTQKFCIY